MMKRTFLELFLFIFPALCNTTQHLNNALITCVASNYLKQKNEGVSLTKPATIKQLLQPQNHGEVFI